MRRIRQALLLTVALALGFAGSQAQLRAPEPPPFPPPFKDVAASHGVVFRLDNSPTSQKYLPEIMGGGVAVFDYDNDGRLDIFFTSGAQIDDPMPAGKTPEKTSPRFSNRLFHQNPDGTFTDVTAKAGLAGTGYSMGTAVGDFDNDGFEDLVVTGLDRLTLYHNNGDGTFTDVTARSGTATPGWSSGAGFFDYDNDGKLDLFVTRYVQWNFATAQPCGTPPDARTYCHPLSLAPGSSVLYHNNGDGTFTDLSRASGISALPGRGLGVAFADYDDDGRPDIFVANDSMQSFLFHNNGNGTFTERGTAAGVGYTDDGAAYAGMGVDFADYDNDGRPDLVVTDLALQTYMLFRNLGGGSFSSESGSSGLSRITRDMTGWGIKWADFDNDGWKDLFVAQGHTDDERIARRIVHTFRQKPLLLKNDHGRLAPWSASASPIDSLWAGRGAAFGDLDNDGAIDVVVSNLSQNAYILHNGVARGNHWIGISLRGTRSNRDGIGAKVKITSATGAVQYYTVNTAGSYLCSSDRRVLAGLGQSDTVAEIEVRWPSGTAQKVASLKADRWIALAEPESKP